MKQEDKINLPVSNIFILIDKYCWKIICFVIVINFVCFIMIHNFLSFNIDHLLSEILAIKNRDVCLSKFIRVVLIASSTCSHIRMMVMVYEWP